MILSFQRQANQEFAEGNRVRAFDGIERKRRLNSTSSKAAMSLLDLDLPGNRLEILKGNRKGQHSIRINDQWRIALSGLGERRADER